MKRIIIEILCFAVISSLCFCDGNISVRTLSVDKTRKVVGQLGIVKSETANIYEERSVTSAKYFVASKDMRLVVVCENGDWYGIKMTEAANGKLGWIEKKNLRLSGELVTEIYNNSKSDYTGGNSTVISATGGNVSFYGKRVQYYQRATKIFRPIYNKSDGRGNLNQAKALYNELCAELKNDLSDAEYTEFEAAEKKWNAQRLSTVEDAIKKDLQLYIEAKIPLNDEEKKIATDSYNLDFYAMRCYYLISLLKEKNDKGSSERKRWISLLNEAEYEFINSYKFNYCGKSNDDHTGLEVLSKWNEDSWAKKCNELLNKIYAYHKRYMMSSDFKQLQAKQDRWLTDRQAMMNQQYNENDCFSDLAGYGALWDLDRAYYLIYLIN